jgi:hypothetical protein
VNEQELLRLEAEARHARERFQLYKARTYGPRPTDPSHLRELDSSCRRAETRLRRARTVPDQN